MSELFKEQSLLTVSAPTGFQSLDDADEKKILYRKPSGETGSWDANVSGASLTYSFVDGDIDEAGKWMFQAYILVGGLKGFGRIKTRHFQNPLI